MIVFHEEIFVFLIYVREVQISLLVIFQLIFIIPDTVVPPYGAGELSELHELNAHLIGRAGIFVFRRRKTSVKSDDFFFGADNPVAHGIVFRAEDYVFSSSIESCGGQGLLEIDRIE